MALVQSPASLACCCMLSRSKSKDRYPSTSPPRKPLRPPAAASSKWCLPWRPLRPGNCELDSGLLQAWHFGGLLLFPAPEEEELQVAAPAEVGPPTLLRGTSRCTGSYGDKPDHKGSPVVVPVSADGPVQRQISKDSVKSTGSRLSTLQRALSKRLVLQKNKPNFHGNWVCTETWGLDAFLKSIGVSKMERMAASRAPWPSWEFSQDGDAITLVNHTCFGDLREEFKAGGPEYTMIDGRKQRQTCKAFWDGATLVIERSGPQGRFREERLIDRDGLLRFVLRAQEPGKDGSWGRVFRRR